MRTTFTEHILAYLQLQAENVVDLLDIMTSSRPVSYRKARRSLLYGPPEFKHDWADLYRKRQQFYSLLNHLKHEGLVVKKKRVGRSLWHITKAGVRKLSLLRERREKNPALPPRSYIKKKGSDLIVVSFDVPERERRKRDWLREVLASLGLNKLQQSVWVGKAAIPEEFISDLRKSNMMSYVHIFSVSRSGTMTERI